MKRRIRKNPLNNKGFSLVELIIVIAIMAILLGVMAPNLLKYIEKSKEAKHLSNADTFRRCFELATIDVQMDGKVKPVQGGSFNMNYGEWRPDSKGNDDYNKALKKVLDDTFTGNYDNMYISAGFDSAGNATLIYIDFKEGRKTYHYAYSQTNKALIETWGTYKPIENSDWYRYIEG